MVYSMEASGNLESLYPFPEHVIIQDRLSAMQYSKNIFKQGMIERCLVMWVDGSVERFSPVRKASRLTCAAVRYLDFSSKDWMELVTLNTLPYGTPFAVEAEMIAIHEAFCRACELANDFDNLVVFSDCQSLLQGLRTKSTFRFLSKPYWIASLFRYANMLYDLGITAELRWVPAHSSVEGNERVDELARRLRRSAQSLLAKEQPDLILSHVTIIPGSGELLRKVLFHKVQQNEKNKSKPVEAKLRTQEDFMLGRERLAGQLRDFDSWSKIRGWTVHHPPGPTPQLTPQQDPVVLVNEKGSCNRQIGLQKHERQQRKRKGTWTGQIGARKSRICIRQGGRGEGEVVGKDVEQRMKTDESCVG